MYDTYTLLVFIHLIILVFISFVLVTNGLSMRMIPIDSPYLKNLSETSTFYEKLQFFNNISVSRINTFRKDLARHDIGLKLTRLESNLFATQLHMGDGGFYRPYVLLDTGSDVTWVQCAGCNPCFHLRYESFNYRSSRSFARMDIHDFLCYNYPLVFVYDGSCGLSIRYGSSSPNPRVTGLLGRENFYFMNSVRTSDFHEFRGVTFGCGLRNENMIFGLNTGSENIIAGILGLSYSPRSILAQLSDHTQGKFSYCLQPWTQLRLAERTLYFGDDANIHGDATRQVKTISMYSGLHYHLFLNGISVNENRLPIDPSVFLLDVQHHRTGFIIDSGTPFTLFTRSAYDIFRDGISEFFRENYGWVPRPDGHAGFDLCYPMYPNYIDNTFPTVTLHFINHEQSGEINMVLTRKNLFAKSSTTTEEDAGFCMMIAVIDNAPSVFGAFQQANFNILYDVHNNHLSFVPKICL